MKTFKHRRAERQRALAFLAAGLAVILASSCAAYNPRLANRGNKAQYAQAGSSGDGYECPEYYNAMPYDNWMANVGGGFLVGMFKVCKNGSRLKVSGNLLPASFSGSSSTMICVYPALVESGYLVPIPDGPPNPNGGVTNALRQCHPLNGDGEAEFDFSGASVQGVFIVEGRGQFPNQMNDCLITGNPQICPREIIGQPANSGYWSYGTL
ncbi:MAG: hypothetical protein AB7P04_15745 [Bacteriovoracia bacterium]